MDFTSSNLLSAKESTKLTWEQSPSYQLGRQSWSEPTPETPDFCKSQAKAAACNQFIQIIY